MTGGVHRHPVSALQSPDQSRGCRWAHSMGLQPRKTLFFWSKDWAMPKHFCSSRGAAQLGSSQGTCKPQERNRRDLWGRFKTLLASPIKSKPSFEVQLRLSVNDITNQWCYLTSVFLAHLSFLSDSYFKQCLSISRFI